MYRNGHQTTPANWKWNDPFGERELTTILVWLVVYQALHSTNTQQQMGYVENPPGKWFNKNDAILSLAYTWKPPITSNYIQIPHPSKKNSKFS